MQNQIKKGDRVNISVKITDEWQSNHELFNAIVHEVNNDLIIVGVDSNSTHTDFCPFFTGGYFYQLGYNIEKI